MKTTTTSNDASAKQIIENRKLNIRIELDASEIYPNDPGQGTPAMVYSGRHSGTFWRAVAEGELDNCELTAEQGAWLESQESSVEAFMSAHSKGMYGPCAKPSTLSAGRPNFY